MSALNMYSNLNSAPRVRTGRFAKRPYGNHVQDPGPSDQPPLSIFGGDKPRARVRTATVASPSSSRGRSALISEVGPSSRSFLGLPRELRVEIFQFATHVRPVLTRLQEKRRFLAQLRVIAALRLVCHQVKAEAEEDYFGRVQVHLGATPGHSGLCRHVLNTGVYGAETRHVRFTWRRYRRGSTNDIPQAQILDWVVRLPKLRTIEVVISDPKLLRCTTAVTRRGSELERLNIVHPNVSLFNVVNADKLLQLRGLEAAVVTIKFADAEKQAEWERSDFVSEFKTIFYAVARLPKNFDPAKIPFRRNLLTESVVPYHSH